MEITKTITPKNRSAWRLWLEKNHNLKKEIWIIYYKKSSGRRGLVYAEAVKEALCFGWIDGIVKSIDDKCYAQRFTPRRSTSAWSKINVGYVKELAKRGLMSEAGFRAFALKKIIYDGGRINTKWHRSHNGRLKGASLKNRIAWHVEHQKYCGCRPMPEYIKRSQEIGIRD